MRRAISIAAIANERYCVLSVSRLLLRSARAQSTTNLAHFNNTIGAINARNKSHAGDPLENRYRQPESVLAAAIDRNTREYTRNI